MRCMYQPLGTIFWNYIFFNNSWNNDAITKKIGMGIWDDNVLTALTFQQKKPYWIKDIKRWRKNGYMVIFTPFQIRFSRNTLKSCLFVSAMCARFFSPHIIQEVLLLNCGGRRIRPCIYSRPWYYCDPLMKFQLRDISHLTRIFSCNAKYHFLIVRC